MIPIILECVETMFLITKPHIINIRENVLSELKTLEWDIRNPDYLI